MQSQAQPAVARLDVLDAIRGFALCGILLINIVNMGWLMDSDEPARGVRDGGLSTALWWVQSLLVHGNMRGLFSLLFGASMLLFLAKAERGSATSAEANRLMLRRLFWLFMFGVVDMSILLWPGDILNIYAIAGLIVLPFALAKPRTLAIGAAIALAGVWSIWPRTSSPSATSSRGRPPSKLERPPDRCWLQPTGRRWKHGSIGEPDNSPRRRRSTSNARCASAAIPTISAILPK